jgi:hypothetical protein
VFERDMNERDDRDADADQPQLQRSLRRRRMPVQAGNQIGNCHVKQARCCQREHRRQNLLHRRDRAVTGEPAGQSSRAGREVVGKGAPARIARVHQHRKVTHLLRNGVGDDRQRGRRSQGKIGDERGRDNDPIAEVVDAVADHDHQAGAPAVGTVCELRRAFWRAAVQGRGFVVAVPPQHELLE